MSKYSNSKYKLKYLKYKNKYLQEKYELENDNENDNINNNINIKNINNKNIVISETSSISEKKPNLNNTTVKTLNINEKKNILPKKINMNNIIYDSDGEGGFKSTFPKLSYDYKENISNIEISENSNEENGIITKTSKKTSKKPSKKPSKKTSKKPSKKTSKKPSKKTSKKPSKKPSKISLSNKIYSEKINWNEISKKEVKKINFTKNKITIKFDKSLLELGYTKTSNETTWLDKFIRINILDKEPVYDPDDICNIKIDNPFIKPTDDYKKFIEYENLVGKKIKSIKWIGDSWMYPSNKQECDRNHIFKIQTTGSEYYLFILRCSSSGGIDSNLTINYKK